VCWFDGFEVFKAFELFKQFERFKQFKQLKLKIQKAIQNKVSLQGLEFPLNRMLILSKPFDF